jgi:hypothetical protein
MPNILQRLFEEPDHQEIESSDSDRPIGIADWIIASGLLSLVGGVGIGLWRSDTEPGLIAGAILFALSMLAIIATNTSHRS